MRHDANKTSVAERPDSVPLVIFACIDDVHAWFSAPGVRRALQRLVERHVPLVLVSAGSPQEILLAQQSIGMREPFVCGGRALLYMPSPGRDGSGSTGNGWRVVETDANRDAGRAIRLLISLYRACNQEMVVVGSGRDEHDCLLLREVDVPIVVRHDRIDQVNVLRELPWAYLTSAQGSEGWLEAVFGGRAG
jgi:predicted mannosyl-3-phosphoglycerate phosphatase (HAD superfamily)